jgi:Uncharacterized conserved protein
MLLRLELENFKPFATSTVVKLAPITLIYGPNSGGKSSIIQALMAIRQSINTPVDESRPLVSNGRFVDLGSFKSLVHRHDSSRTVRLGIHFDDVNRWQGDESVSPMFVQARRYSINSRRVTLSYSATESGRSDLTAVNYAQDGDHCFDIILRKAAKKDLSKKWRRAGISARAAAVYTWLDRKSVESYRQALSSFSSTFLGRVRRDAQRREAEVRHLEEQFRRSLNQISKLTGDVTEIQSKYLLDLQSRIHEIKSRESREIESHELMLLGLDDAIVVATGALPDTIALPPEALEGADALYPRSMMRRRSGELLERFVSDFTAIVDGMRYLGPLRSYPLRQYVITGSSGDSVGRSGEFTAFLLHQSDSAVLDSTNRWFRQFGIPYLVDTGVAGTEMLGDILTVSLTDRSGVAVTPADVGFGIGQLLPILVEGTVASRSLICVEQPEIHLHPRLQAHIADFLIATAKTSTTSDEEGVGRNQWIVETHSESLMLRIQRRIREGKISPSDVSVIFVEPSLEGSRVHHIGLTDKGEFLSEWPGGFFEEDFDEMMD